MNIIKSLTGRRPSDPEGLTQKKRFEITLSGSGGQGMILAGRILAEAASIYDAKNAVMTQSYGPEARGGASRTEIVISSEEIDYPKVMNLDILLVMTQEAMDKYGGMLSEDGLLIVDETFVKNVPEGYKNVFTVDFTSLAIKVFNTPIVANIIALGALVAITKVVPRKALISAVLGRVPKKALITNRIAVDTGYKTVKDSEFKWKSKEGSSA